MVPWPGPSPRWGEVLSSFPMGGTIHRDGGIPILPDVGEYPSFPKVDGSIPHQDWMGVPPVGTGCGWPPIWDWMQVPPIRTGWGTPLRTGQRYPPPNQDWMGYPPPAHSLEWMALEQVMPRRYTSCGFPQEDFLIQT